MILDRTDATILLEVLETYIDDWGPDLSDNELEELESLERRLADRTAR